IKKVEQINKIDFIDAGGRDFDSEEIEIFLKDDSIPLGVEDSPFNMEEEILFLENDGSESIEHVKDDFLIFTTISNPLLDNDNINSDELNSHVESNSDESTSNHDTVKFDNLDEFSGPEEIDVITSTNDVLPPSVENDDSDEEVDDVDDLFSLPPPEPPDEEFDFKIDFRNEILVVRNTIVEFECIDAKVKFDVFNDENDDLSYFMFVIFDKMFSFLSAKSEDTIFDPAIFD
nr:hypothetical protein [Tanacetum cinerariifolium]